MQFAVFSLFQINAVLRRHVKAGPDKLRRDRQLATTAVNQGREPYARRPAVVEELIHRRAYGAPGVEHIVDQYKVAAFDLEWNCRRGDLVFKSLALEIVAIK